MSLDKSTEQKYDLSIIIVSYNSCSVLIKCIESIYRFSENLTIQILVSDNASIDDTVDVLENRFSEIFILQNGKNLGFSVANNRAFAYAKGRFVLFLNPDIILLEPVFRKMIGFLETHHDAGMLGCKLVNADGSIQKSFYNALPTLANSFLEAVYIEKLFEKTSSHEIVKRNHKVAAIVGACIFMKRELYEQLGGFDESFFMYCEDMDLSYRVQQLGFTIYFLGNLSMFHHQGASCKTKQSYFEKVLTKESVYKYFLKHAGKTRATLYKLSMIAASIFRLLVLFTWVPFSRIFGKKYNFNYHTSICKYTRVLSWGLGFESWTKNPG